MRALRLPLANFRLLQSFSWRRDPRSIILRQKSTKASPKVDFLALEAKWQAKWASESRVLQQAKNKPTIYSSLPPLYGTHLPKPSILDALNRSGNFDDSKSAYLDDGMDLDACIRTYGQDITLAHAAFYSGRESRPYSKQGIIKIQKRLEYIWGAVLLAHGSYTLTQANDMPPPISALDEPDLYHWESDLYGWDWETDLNCWTGYCLSVPPSLFHVPPEYPDIFDLSMQEDDNSNVWLAAQEALFSMSQSLNSRNTVQKAESSLITLTKAIIAYGKAVSVLPEVYYHSTRILLLLIAPFAPCFAEECWVALHYGTCPCSVSEDDKPGPLGSIPEGAIEEGLTALGWPRNLPRRGRPETLASIFDQPMPVAHQKTITLLRSSDRLQKAMSKRIARIARLIQTPEGETRLLLEGIAAKKRMERYRWAIGRS